MSSAPAAAAAVAEATPPAKKGPKKLIIIIAAAVLLLSVLAGGALFYMKKKAAAMEAADGDTPDAQVQAKSESDKHDRQPPVFVPLEPFTVNLADKDQDRYLQVGLTFEVADEKTSEEIKTYMPAIRNAVLLILSHKNSQDLLEVAGKEKMAEEIRRGAARAMGVNIPDAPSGDQAAANDGAAKKKMRKHKGEENPIRHVNYSNFIIQ